MDNPSQTPVTSGTRFCHEIFPYYYPYGNTSARNFLEYASPSDLRDPSILVLGCGDIRSCFYTIWKNFDPDFEPRFRGVQFVLNDISAAVLARNVLFLYLCVNLPKTNPSRQKWLFAFWSIWFCHELLPDHESVLQSSLKALLELSVDGLKWFSSDNPLHSFVSFSSTSDTLKEIRVFWNLWYNKEISVDAKTMNDGRKFGMSKHHVDVEKVAEFGVRDMIGGLCAEELCMDNFMEVKQDYRLYVERGSVYGESLTKGSLVHLEKKSVNLTLFERRDGKYSTHYSCCPYRCFHNLLFTSTQEMVAQGLYVTDLVRDCVHITPEAFERVPLLANSFRQFSSWITCTSNMLFQQPSRFSFTFDCSDVLDFCHSWEDKSGSKFDLIYSSNLLDTLAPPAFVLAAIRLLANTGYLFTTIMLTRRAFPSAEVFLEKCFGFHPKLLPVICGVRCINQEGDAYSCAVSPHHIPCGDGSQVHVLFERMWIWEKVNMDPLCMESLASCPEICGALYNSFLVFCTPLVENPRSLLLQNCLCSATAVQMLRVFSTRVDPAVSSLYTFWKKLCSDLKQSSLLSPFLASIQIQAILNKVHLHLTVDEKSCPLCTRSQLTDHWGSFTLEGEIKIKNSLYNCFLVQLVSKSNLPTQQIDCLTGVHKGSTIKITFIAPLTYLKDGCTAALTQYFPMANTRDEHKNLIEKLNENDLVNCHTAMPTIPALLEPQYQSKPSTSLGTIIRHIGNGDSFESTLAFTAKQLPGLLEAKLQVIQNVPTEVKVECLQQSSIFTYPYPVGKLVVQRSKKDKALTVKVQRVPHQYEDKGQLFHVNPNDQFTLQPMSRTLESCRQSSIEDADRGDSKMRAAMFEVKVRCFDALQTMIDQFFFFVRSLKGELVGFIKVNNRVLDVKRGTPAIDISYYFIDTLTSEPVLRVFITNNFTTHFNPIEISFTMKETYSLLVSLFNSFASHTFQTSDKYPLSKKNRLFLNDCGIAKYFTRAVLYPLYPDADLTVAAIRERRETSARMGGVPEFSTKMFWEVFSSVVDSRKKKHFKEDNDSGVDSGCSYCHEKSRSLKLCTRCQKASYCGRECQRNHWKEHKPHCFLPMPASGETKNTSKCSYCKQTTDKPKKCSGCEKETYCSKQCQVSHWKEHKILCKSANQTSHESKLRTSPSEPPVVPKEKHTIPTKIDEHLEPRTEKSHKIDKPRTEKSSKIDKHLEPRTGKSHSTKIDKHLEPRTGKSHSTKIDKHLEPRMEKSRSTKIDKHLEPRTEKSHSTKIDKHLEPRTEKSHSTKIDKHLEPRTEKSHSTKIDKHLEPRTETIDEPNPKTLSNGNHGTKERSKVKSVHCTYCQTLTKPLRCDRCHKVSYCGRECQKKHWKEHKKVCMS